MMFSFWPEVSGHTVLLPFDDLLLTWRPGCETSHPKRDQTVDSRALDATLSLGFTEKWPQHPTLHSHDTAGCGETVSVCVCVCGERPTCNRVLG